MRRARSHRTGATISLIVVVNWGIFSVAAAAAQASLPCEGWAAPVAVFPDSSTLANPSLVFAGAAEYFIGNARWPTDLREAGVRIAGSAGSSVPPPDHPGMNYILPVGGAADSGQLVLIWAEPKDRTKPTRPGDRFGSIYRSNFLGDRIRINDQPIYWSSPEPLYQGDDIIWRGARESSIRRSADGTLHLAFPTLDRGVVYLRLRDGRRPSDQTRMITEFLGEQGLYASLALGMRQDVYLPYIAGYSDGAASHPNSVFFRRSLDGGLSWEDRVLISPSEGREAHIVQSEVTSGGEIHLLWRRDILRKNGTLWHSMSLDRGVSWTPPREIAKPDRGNLAGLSVAADSSGALHVAFTSDGDRPHDQLYYLHWKAGSWSRPCSIDPRFAVTHLVPAVAADERGGVHLFWSRALVKGGRELVPVAVRSILESTP